MDKKLRSRKKRALIFLSVVGLFLACEAHCRFHWDRPAYVQFLSALPFSSTVIGPPKGSISATQYGDIHPGCYTQIFPAYEMLSTPFPFTEKKEEILSFPEVFVLTIKGGRVLGRNGVIITPDDQVLEETAIEWGELKKHSIFKKWKLPPLTKKKERIAVIASTGGDCNYFHWMFDVLPRLEILRRSQIPYDKIYLSTVRKNFQKETLAKLGIDSEKVIWGNKRTHLEAEELIVPSLPGKSGFIPAWSSQFLREQFLPSSTPKQHRRIYVSRNQSQCRRVLNEDELMAYLAKWGFEKVYLENLDFASQAELFSSAEIVLASHGAGLTNLIFCSPKTTVIEINNPHYLNPCFWFLTQHLGLDHHCLMGTTPLSKTQDKHHDMYVPLNELEGLFVSLKNCLP